MKNKEEVLEKLRDLLVLEQSNRDAYESLLKYTEAFRFKRKLAELRDWESRHVKMVQDALDMLSS